MADPNPGQPLGGWPVPRAAYIHVPFCRHRCGYCNFSVVAKREDLIDRFLSAIDQELASLDCPAIDTLFIGGGTPTHLPPTQLEQLIGIFHKRFDLSKTTEWSVEANPEDIDGDRLSIISDAGVNRISLGVQSFQPSKLRILERSHTPTAARQAIELAASRIPNVSIDLIFSAPNESLRSWSSDLDQAFTLPIEHLSTYSLTIEKGTSFWARHHQGDIATAGEELEIEMYQLVRSRAADHSMSHYEISNFAHADSRCRHNMHYWQGRGWYAAGPGAARFQRGKREINHRSTTTYLKRIESGQSPVAESEQVSPLQYAKERAAFGVRLIDGVNLRTIERESGIELLDHYGPGLNRLVDDGLVEFDGATLKLSPRGILFADTVASDLLA